MFSSSKLYINNSKENPHSEINSLSKKLYDLVCKQRDFFTEEERQNVKYLLHNGADPCYYEKNKTIVQSLIIQQEFDLLDFILSKSPESCLTIPSLGIYDQCTGDKTIKQEMFFLSCFDPLHLATKFTKEIGNEKSYKIYQLIKKYYPIDKYINELNNMIDELYNVIFQKISTAMLDKKRPLLILFGEEHNSYFTIISQCIAIYIAKQLGVTTYFREEDKTRKKSFKQILKMIEEMRAPIGSSIKTLYSVRMFMNKLHLNILPADLGSDGVSLKPIGDYTIPKNLEERDTLEAIRYRNKIMASEFKKVDRKNIFAEVGAAHLYGLLIEEKLSDFYNVLPFNSANIIQKQHNVTQQQLDFLHSSQVVTLENRWNLLITLEALSPFELIDMIYRRLEQHIDPMISMTSRVKLATP